MTTDLIVVEPGDVTTVRMNSPPLNLISFELTRALDDALRAIERDGEARAVVVAASGEAFLRVMSEARGPDYLEEVYLFGTPEEIVESLQQRIDAGVQRFMLHTLTPDPSQLDQWVTEIVPNVRFPESTA